MKNALENTASMVVLISIGRSTIQSIGSTVEAAQAELDVIIGEAGVWTASDDGDDDAYKALRVPAGEWTGSDADARRAQEIGETVGWYARRDKLRIDGFTIDCSDAYGGPAILASVNGKEELEWLDDDGDVVRGGGISHLDTNRSDIYDDDAIAEIHDAMQAHIDGLPEAEREQLSADCEEAAAEREDAA